MSASLTVAGNLILSYCGTSVFIAGILGGLLNTLVFLSLRTFRQSSCAFYLTIMSIVNIGQLIFYFLPRIMVALIGTDKTETSLFYCKIRPYLSQLCLGSSLSCFCLATIDQYFATCFRPRWQQLCNIKLAHRLVIANTLFWMLHGITYLVYFDIFQSSTTNKTTCASTNLIFNAYRGYFFVLVLSGYLPIGIAALFGFLAYRNVQQLAYRTVPLVRRELEKQITVMVFVQVLVGIVTLTPYTTTNAVSTNNNSVNQVQIQFVIAITNVIYSMYFASPFYIYICASERFRRQFVYVLLKVLAYRWKRPRIGINQVIPET